MLLAESRSACCHSSIHPGKMARHHISVPLNNNDFTLFYYIRLRDINAVQHLVFMVKGCIGGIDIFCRNLIVIIKLPGPKTQGAPGRIADRPGSPSPEVIVNTVILPAPGNTSVHHLLLGIAAISEITD